MPVNQANILQVAWHAGPSRRPFGGCSCRRTLLLTLAWADITDRKRAQEDAERASRDKSEFLAEIKRLNPFLVLGVGYEASDADVRGAFGELTKRYHPDRFARYQSSRLRQLAAEIFILIRDAYRKLADDAGRTQTRAQLGIKQPRSKTPPPIPRKPHRQPKQHKTQNRQHQRQLQNNLHY